MLTPQMIYEFVDKIVVHSPIKVDGEREQQVDIYLKFIGKFDPPMPKLTEEEIKQQERAKKRRAYDKLKSSHAELSRQLAAVNES